MTILNAIETELNGIIQLRLLKNDGGWHRTTLLPGQNVMAQFVAVNEHLAALGQSPVSDADISTVVSVASNLWTPEIVAAFNASVGI